MQRGPPQGGHWRSAIQARSGETASGDQETKGVLRDHFWSERKHASAVREETIVGELNIIKIKITIIVQFNTETKDLTKGASARKVSPGGSKKLGGREAALERSDLAI